MVFDMRLVDAWRSRSIAAPASDDAWQAYWEALPYRPELSGLEATDFVVRLATAIPLRAEWRVLDFGSGFGLIAVALASRVRDVFVWDTSPTMRRWTAENAGRRPNVHLLAHADPRVDGGPGAYDLIVVNSVLQYVEPAQRALWLRQWAAMLTRDGRIVLSDLPSARQSFWRDLVATCRFYARRRRLARVLRARLGDVVRYWRAARVRPLTPIVRDELRREAAAARLTIEFLPASLTHRPLREAAVLRAS